MKLPKLFKWKRWVVVILILLALVAILSFFVSGDGSDLWNMVALRSVTSENTDSESKSEITSEQEQVEQQVKIRLEYKKDKFYLREYKNEIFIKEYPCSSKAKKIDDDQLEKHLKSIQRKNPNLKTIIVEYRVPGEVSILESDRARKIIHYTPGFVLQVVDYKVEQENER